MDALHTTVTANHLRLEQPQRKAATSRAPMCAQLCADRRLDSRAIRAIGMVVILLICEKRDSDSSSVPGGGKQ